MKYAALLPMKANSERVPGKNFRHLGHKPLFKWMLDSLLSVPQISSVIINTDAERELTEGGLDPDAPGYEKVLLRPRKPELQGDFVSMNLIIEDDLASTDADAYIMTHVTNPFLSAQTIMQALARFEEHEHADSLFSVNRFQTRFYREDGSAINHDPRNLIRTQDLEPYYEENSCLYLFTAESFRSTNARIGQTPILFETPRMESIDIDEPEDWDLAEAIATHMAGL